MASKRQPTVPSDSMVLTPKQEAFAAQYVRTGNGSEAYRRAYDVGADTKPETVWSEASRLLANPLVTARVMELQQAAADQAVVTVERIAIELEKARELAMDGGNPSAAVAASMGKAKLFGLLIDKRQHSGPTGGSIPIFDVSKLKDMTDEELDLLERALVQIGITNGDDEDGDDTDGQ